jgi:hypothetical protein
VVLEVKDPTEGNKWRGIRRKRTRVGGLDGSTWMKEVPIEVPSRGSRCDGSAGGNIRRK